MEFTHEYFNQELLRFREVMGNKVIMQDEEKSGKALSGFTLVYFNTKTDREDELRTMFVSTVREFEMRKAMLFKLSLRSLIEV